MAFSWPRNPVIYEINTWTWLHALSEADGEPVTLATVSDSVLDDLATWGFDVIWLMGVWERSPTGRTIAVTHPDLQAAYHRALPDFTPEDVVGSPYAVHGYDVDPRLGGRAGLVALRERLAARGLGLMLDFVPNHFAVDHPWLLDHPACFIQGGEHDLAAQPDAFFRGPNGRIFAHGRDPYFPVWTDTVQVNVFSPTLRTRIANTLLHIASLCDGVRCDMAMLVTNRVFKQTWGDRAGQAPPVEYWDVLIPAIQAAHPGFMFIAEVYWDMEWELQQQGFDYTYDKRLYDRLLHAPVPAINGHLGAEIAYQNHLVRFIENHDEPRAAVALGPERERMAAVLAATLPGALLLHEGQLAGHKVRLPVQLRRRPLEQDDPAIELFYRVLVGEIAHPIYRDGTWKLRAVYPAWKGNGSNTDLIAYAWRDRDERRLIVINYSGFAAQGRVRLVDFDVAGRRWQLADVLHPGAIYTREGSEMATEGLYIDLPPWSAHLFRFE